MPKPSAIMNLEKGERFYKFFFFRPRWGRHKQFEYRIFVKEKADGNLAMAAYNFKIENGVPIKDHVTEAPDVPKAQLMGIIRSVLRNTNTLPDEFEEIDLSHFKTVDEQIEFLKSSGRADVSYLH
ncbi:MAG: hypothetical protein ONB44_13780 [candidate division KSB1 bacterium]|nr:hypothetical protein [candidate division KSB1 bacterium]MDZ7303194.1 hypothetical protein [candidate division KSB1 bacterium]MDZ7312194.1 hypothetical protein [candidate division KSB1 bacterium]